MSNGRNTAVLTDVAGSLAGERVRQALGVVTFTILTAIAARISLPIPGTPIPFSFQPMVVLLAGGLLGARLGAASQVLYLLAGLVGLPVFALGSILAPSGGYLMAYPFAAFAVGAIMNGAAVRRLIALLAGLLVIYAGGVAWLSLSVGFVTAFTGGVLPFVLFDLIKVVIAFFIVTGLAHRTRSFFAA